MYGRKTRSLRALISSDDYIVRGMDKTIPRFYVGQGPVFS